MIAKFCSILVFTFLIAPTLTLFHELGHAIVPVLKGESVKINVGQKQLLSFQIKNLNLEIGFLKPWIGYTSWSGESSIDRLILGPIFSLLLAVIFYFLSKVNYEYKGIVIASMWWCFFQFLFTAWPAKYPAWLGYSEQDSDGLQIVQLLKK